MKNMFDGCKSLANLNLSNFKTQKIAITKDMFRFCNLLTKKDIITKDKKILKEFKNK